MLAEAKGILLSAVVHGPFDASSSPARAAIEALPDRTLLDQLDPLARALIETRLYQLVTLAVVS